MTLIKNDKEYVAWIAELSKRYRQSQIKAAIKVNSEMLKFYWSVGKDITERQFDNKYGTHFYENLSRDLYAELGVKKGLSPSSLWYTKRFYDLYSTIPSFLQHFVGKSEASNLQQVVGKIKETNSQQVADDFEILFKIPWGHHCRIIDKVKGDARKGLFFVRKTLENNWGRGVLMNSDYGFVRASRRSVD